MSLVFRSSRLKYAAVEKQPPGLRRFKSREISDKFIDTHMYAAPHNFSLSATQMDAADPLAGFRELFHFPKASDGSNALYFTGNSLGLQPKNPRK
jgi:hypothetical protein